MEQEIATCKDEIKMIKTLLWGAEINRDIFRRWSQGFYFSTNEKSALEQLEGGPCAIIAPVQAFIVKKLLTEFNGLSFQNSMTVEMQKQVLVHALCEILQQCCTENFKIVSFQNPVDLDKDSVNESLLNGENAGENTGEDSENLEPDTFHDNLEIRTYNLISDVKKYYKDSVNMLGKQYGVLLFLYSVIASKDPRVVQSEADTADLFIDAVYGYGSQCLINLIITGRAVNYVWDNFQDVGGLKLSGLNKQSQIGFITLMEHLRYITVGFYYKNPVHPIWVLGSETHLTVLFSDDRKLVSPETKSEQARRVFKSFDPYDNNFISSSSLQEVLAALDLVSDQEYVDIMAKKLDNESLGIILLNPFMDEFFPIEESSTPDMFQLIHYNGLAQSNINKQVQYHYGSAILLESNFISTSESNPMLMCLQTKWPSIDVQWCDNITPSLN